MMRSFFIGYPFTKDSIKMNKMGFSIHISL